MSKDSRPAPAADQGGEEPVKEGYPLLACFGQLFNRRSELVSQLSSTERVTRLHALKSLAQASGRTMGCVEPQLIAALQGKDDEERAAAAEAVRTHYQLERLRRRLGHPEPAKQVNAAWLISAFESADIIPILFYKAQSTEHAMVRDACLVVLTTRGGEAVITAAVEELSRDLPVARESGSRVLTSMGERAHSLLAKALGDPRWQVRLGAVRALEAIGDSEFAQALVELLADPVEEVRAEAARVLSEQDSAAATERLLGALADPSVMVRLQAAAALTRVPGEQAEEAVSGFLRGLAADADFEVADREFLLAVAAKRELPAALFLHLLGGANEQFAINLALALEEAGTVTWWIEQLPTADAASRPVLLELLQALGRLGVREPYLAGLGLASPELRAICAWLLGECKHHAAVGPLVGLLTDSEVVVRRRAAQALGKVGDPLAIPALVETLGDPDQEVRASAVASLSTMLAESSEEPPVEAQEGALVPVEDNAETGLAPVASRLPAVKPSPYTLPSRFSEALGRLAMATAHSHLGADSVLTSASALLRCLHDPSAAVREKAAEAMADLGLGSAAGPLMERALHDSEPRVRVAAARALARLPGGDYAGALVRALGHSDPGVRGRAAEALGESGASHAAPELIAALGDPHHTVRQRAARALWQVAGHGMTEHLLEHLHNPDPKIRCAIAGVLGKIRAVGALEALANRLEDPNKHVRASALNALNRLGADARGCLHRIIGCTSDPDEYVRARAVETLGVVGAGEPDQVTALLEATRDREPKVAELAMKWLVQTANDGTLRPLVDALATPEYEASVRAVLEKVDLSVLRTLLRIAREVNETTSRVLLAAIAEVLRKRGSLEDCRLDLLSLDPTVRLAGLESLGLLKRPEATELIIEVMFNDPLPTLRERAAGILAELDDPVGLAALARARAQSVAVGAAGQ